MKEYIKLLAMVAAVMVVQVLYFRFFSVGRDDTDPPAARSGLTIRIDHLTGCQYLDRDGLTPRIAADGKTHLGCKENP